MCTSPSLSDGIEKLLNSLAQSGLILPASKLWACWWHCKVVVAFRVQPKSHIFLHKCARSLWERMWLWEEQEKCPFHYFVWVGLRYLRVSWGWAGSQELLLFEAMISLLLWGWSKPSASHLNCSWGILRFCLLYPRGIIYTNKREQKKNLHGKPLMFCAETPCTISYVKH